MQNVAQAWLVYRLTGSSVLLGLVSFCGQIPVFLIAPLGGIVADRFRRQRVVIGTQTAAMLLALVLAALTITGAVRIWHVFVLAALLGVVNAFDIPARQAPPSLLALVRAPLTTPGAVRIWHVFVLAALLGVVNAFDIPAGQAFFVEMVGREDLINAIALRSEEHTSELQS